MPDTKELNQEKFYKIPKHILRDYNLNASDIKVYAVLKTFMSTSGEAYASNKWLSNECCIDDRSVMRSIKKLCDLKLFKCFKENGKRYLTDSFTVHPKDAPDYTHNSSKNKLNNTQLGGDKVVTRGDNSVTQRRQSCHPKVTELSLEVPDTLYINKINEIDYLNKKTSKKKSRTDEIPTSTQASTSLCRASSTSRSKTKSDDIVFIFEHWKSVMGHQRAKIGEKRRKVIANALNAGYSVDDLCEAINGCKNTTFNMGDNDRNQVYDHLELILRECNIDRFIRNASRVAVTESNAYMASAAKAAASLIKKKQAMKKQGGQS